MYIIKHIIKSTAKDGTPTEITTYFKHENIVMGMPMHTYIGIPEEAMQFVTRGGASNYIKTHGGMRKNTIIKI